MCFPFYTPHHFRHIMAAVNRNIKLTEFDDTQMFILEWVHHFDMGQIAAGWTDVQTCSRAKMFLNGKAAGWTDVQTCSRAKMFLNGKAMVWLQNRIVAQTEGLNRWYPSAKQCWH